MTDPFLEAYNAYMAQKLADDLAALSDEQRGQLQFLVDQVKDPDGMREFQIPKQGIMGSADEFPTFMCLYLSSQGLGDIPNLFDMRDPDYVILKFFI